MPCISHTLPIILHDLLLTLITLVSAVAPTKFCGMVDRTSALGLGGLYSKHQLLEPHDHLGCAIPSY
jgi:hypothetical protein